MIADKADQIAGSRKMTRIVVDNPLTADITIGFELEWDIAAFDEQLKVGTHPIAVCTTSKRMPYS
jgi:hypothetical protein